jgi:hypothetical protein
MRNTTPTAERRYDVVERGYPCAAVDAAVGQLQRQCEALELRAAELEGALLAFTPSDDDPPTLLALIDAEAMLREAYEDARTSVETATAAAERDRHEARCEVAADLAELDAEIADVHRTAVTAGAHMVEIGRARALDTLAENAVTLERSAEYAEHLVAVARRRATAVATGSIRTGANRRARFSEDLATRQSGEVDRRKAVTREASSLKAEAKRIAKNAERDVTAIRTEALRQAKAVLADTAGEAGQLERETDAAMHELALAMRQLSTAVEAAAAAPAPVASKPVAPTRVAPGARRTPKPPAAKTPAVVRPVQPEPLPRSPSVRPAVDAAPAGFVPLKPTPVVPVRRVVPAAVPAAAVAAARRAKRGVTVPVEAAGTLPFAPGGPSCLGAAGSSNASVTVLKTR